MVAHTSLHFVHPLQLFGCTISIFPAALALKFSLAHALMHLPQSTHFSSLILTLNPVGLIPWLMCRCESLVRGAHCVRIYFLIPETPGYPDSPSTNMRAGSLSEMRSISSQR